MNQKKDRQAAGLTDTQLEAVRDYIMTIIRRTRRRNPAKTPGWVRDLYEEVKRESLNEARLLAEGKVWMFKQVPSKPGGANGDEHASARLLFRLTRDLRLKIQDLPGWSQERQARAVKFWQSWQNAGNGRLYNPRLMDPQNPTDLNGVCNEKYAVGLLKVLGAKPKRPWRTAGFTAGGPGEIDTERFLAFSKKLLNSGECSHIGAMCHEIMKDIDDGRTDLIPALEEGMQNIMAQQDPDTGLWDKPCKGVSYSHYSPTAGALKLLVRFHGYMGMEGTPHMEKLADTLIEKQAYFHGVDYAARNTSELMICCLENSDYRRNDLLDAITRNVESLEGRGRSNYILACIGEVGGYIWRDCPFHNERGEPLYSRGAAYQYRVVVQEDGKTVKLVRKKPEEFVWNPGYRFRLYGRLVQSRDPEA